MTWPGWGEVFPSVVGAVTLFAVLVGGMRALTHTVAEQASAAAKDAAKEATDALYERLKNNDFRHVEERIDRGLAEAHADREAMETRIRERFDRMGARMERMEARILAAVRRPSDADVAEAPSEAERAEKRSSPGP